jgi:phosphoribosyl 1,2-cyclic phosphodiesterase
VDRLLDVDLLALEFNHDPELLRNSSRPPWLVRRILGDEGHLSNAQAAALVSETLKHSDSTRLQQLVLLHISHECNSPELAVASARAALELSGCDANVFAAEQQQRSPTFVVGEAVDAEKAGRLVQAVLF